MKLRQLTGAAMVSECKEYWGYHSATPSCFADLRPFVEMLPTERQVEFHITILRDTMAVKDKQDLDQVYLSCLLKLPIVLTVL